MKKIAVLIGLVQFLLCFNFSVANNYSFEPISPDAGFSYNQVQSIVLDHNGMVWFSCANILYTYNSNRVSIVKTTTPNSELIALGDINQLYFDDYGKLWICADNGLFTFNRNTNAFSKAKTNNPDFQDYSATSIVQLNDSVYWCKSGSSLYVYNTNSLSFEQLRINNSKFQGACRTVIKDKSQTVWLGMANGNVFKYNNSVDKIELFHTRLDSPVTSICVGELYVWIGYEASGVDKVRIDKAWSTHYDENMNYENLRLLSNRVREIIKRENGEVWIGSFGGINVINEHKNTSIVSDHFNKLPYNSVFELVQDNFNGVWVGTWAGGLAYFNEFDYRFKHIKKIPFDSKIPKNNISSFAQDKEGNLYVATENAGLKSFNRKTNVYNSYEPVNEMDEPLQIKSIAADGKQLYLGTTLQGLWRGNVHNHEFKKINHPILQNRVLHKILVSNQGVWVAVYGKGILHYHPSTGKNTVYNHENTNGGITSDYVRTLYLDHSNNLWVGSDNGLSVKLNNSNEFKNLSLTGKYKTFYINSIYEVEDGKIWVATKNQEIFEIDNATLGFKLINRGGFNDLSEVFSIQTDDEGNVWFSTRKGIIEYSPEASSFTHFSQDEVSSISSFNPNAGFKTSNGNLFFGSTNGFLIVSPDEEVINPNIPNVYLSTFTINNELFEKANIKQSNSHFLPDLKNISLFHTDNNLSFSFVTNNYVKPFQNKYRCRLTNYQDEWIDLGTKNEVSYTQIPPGKYELQVLGSNNNDVWSTTPYSLLIQISPPLWRTTAAYLVYIILLIAIVSFLVKELLYRSQLKRNLLIERVRHESEEKLFVEKQKFFTNISHELRTPLSLIISPLNILLASLKNNKKLSDHIRIAQRNADRLLRLTNEILDMRAIENGKIKLDIQKENIVTICQEAFNCFTYEAIDKKINYTFSSKFEECIIEIDSSKIEKVVFNLLSNAFKFTPQESQIILSVDFNELSNYVYENAFYTGNKFSGECLEIKVINFGESISLNDLEHIFDRFATLSNISTSGTGLGLHIAKEYIELHKGNIFVSSQLENGTVFTINLPTKSLSVVENKNILLQANLEYDEDIALDKEGEISRNEISDKVILIIEDNSDLRKYIQNEIVKHYKVLTAVNGRQGYEIALEVNPDLIVSDIMMPEMDGNELTKKIKTTPETEDIPVILLTALAEKSSKIEGITQGADAYLVKPVEMDLLLTHINNLIESKEKIAQKLRNQRVQIEAGEIAKPLAFIEQLEILIVKNFLNPNFGLNEILDELNMSKSSFYRKLKKGYNQTYTEFINDVRLKRAVELIKSTENSLDEIAFQVGFNSYSYFSRVFKQKYGKSPKQFATDL